MKNTGRVRSALRGGVLLLLLVSAPFVTAQTAAPNWTQLSPAGGPPIDRGTSAVLDTATNRMVIFGGASGDAVFVPSMLNDLWVLTSADGLGGTPTWTQLNPLGTIPTARAGNTSVYDAAMNRMIVFGGNQSIAFCGGEVNDVWVLSNANGLGGTPSWQQLSPVGGPPSRRWVHSAVYDPANNRMIVFGGAPACGPANGEVWVLTNANGLGGAPAWTQLSPIGGPGTIASHSAVYDRGSNRMIVFGGCDSATCPSADVWILSNANGLGGTPTWTKLNPTGGPPLGRANHTAVYDPATNRMTIYAGQICPSVCGDVWVLSHANGLGGTPNWTQLSPGGGPPNPRCCFHIAVFTPASNRMTVFGGVTLTGGHRFLGDVWVLTNANGIVVITVEIDIKPGSFPNSINPRSQGLIPVAILSSASFDAPTVVNKSSVRFGRTGNEASLAFCNASGEDVNVDGLLDLVCHFFAEQTGFQSGDTVGVLKGQTVSGTPFTGTDSVQIRP